MKKLISILLALVFVFSMATVAFATEGEGTGSATYNDMTEVTIKKTYTVTNDNTSYPNETFAFTIDSNYTVEDGGVGSDKQNVPTIGSVSFVTADGTATKDVKITLPVYTAVGIYSYTVKETTGSTAGVDYYDKDITLKVTVMQEESGKIRVAAVHTEETGAAKSNVIENVYNAGSLSVTKKVAGALADREEYFPVVITLTAETGKVYTGNTISVGRTSNTKNPTAVTVGTPATFYLKHNETITLGNIPYGVTYTVVETTPADYEATYNFSDVAKKIDSASDTVEITNTKDTQGAVDTGISLDSVPFILILAVCAGAAILFVTKRRSVEF